MTDLLNELSWKCDIGPYSIEGINETMQIHVGPKMVMYVPQKETFLPKGVSTHTDYSFIIPLSMPMLLTLGKKDILLGKNCILASNTCQECGSAGVYPAIRFISIHFDKNFVEDTSHLIFGKQGFFFQGESLCVCQEVFNLIFSFIEESWNRQAGYQFVLESLSTHIIVKLMRDMKNNMQISMTERSYKERAGISRVIDFLMENYNHDFSLEDVSRMAGFSVYYFIRIFKSYTGMTPHEYLSDIRIKKARELLRNKEWPVTAIAGICGYYSPNHFATAFKKRSENHRQNIATNYK